LQGSKLQSGGAKAQLPKTDETKHQTTSRAEKTRANTLTNISYMMATTQNKTKAS